MNSKTSFKYVVSELRTRMYDDFAKRSERVDNTVKNDSRAVKIFTQLEGEQMAYEKTIRDFLSLVAKYNVLTK